MASPTRPGIEIQQELSETPAVTAAPTLVPVVIGVCNQIITTLDDEGALNPDAKYSAEKYNQATMLVTQAEFPDPRENIDEVNVYEDSVETALYFGGKLYSLPRGSHGSYGSAFLAAKNLATRAAIRSTEAGPFAFDGTIGDVLTLAFDVVNPSNTSRDVVATLVGTLSAQELADEINDAVGKDVASVFTDTLGDFGPAGAEYLQLTSLTWGAVSSITLRQGTSALKKLFGASFNDAKSYRVVGAGFCGQDDLDGDLFTPWIEFYRGAYMEATGTGNFVDTTFPPDCAADEVWAGLINLDGVFNAAKAAQQIFLGPSATVPLVQATSSKPGDQFWADGAKVGSSEIIKLEQSRFKLGKLNTSLSTYDDEGNATTRVYDTVEVNTLNHGNAFAPKYSYFVADGLVFGSVLPAGVAANITGTGGGGDITLERAAIVQSSSPLIFALDINLASLTLIYEVVEDGVSLGEQVFTFTLGPYTTIGQIVTALTGQMDGVTVGNSGNLLVLQTTKTGADQSLTIKPSGTANPLLNFSSVTATTDTGKDTEYIGKAELTSEVISLPLVGLSSATLEITVTDSKGIHSLSATGIDLTVADMSLLVKAIAEAFGSADGSLDPTFYDGAIAVATISTPNVGAPYGTLVIKSFEGGASVSAAIVAVDGTDGFRNIGFYDAAGGKWAETTGTALTFPISFLITDNIKFDYDDGGGPVTLQSAQVLSAPRASALAALLNAIPALTEVTGTRVVWFIGDDSTDEISIRTILGGTSVSLAVDITAPGSIILGFAAGGAGTGTTGSNADASGADTLKNTTLGFWLDDNPFQYEVTFTTNSLTDAVDEINLKVNGSTDVASESGGFLTLTSLLKGSASKVEINDVSTAAVVLGLSGEAFGSGRPNPNFYLDGSGSVVVGASILRNATTGEPFSLESAMADLYIAYKGLRLDVSSSAMEPGMPSFGTTALMESAIGPVSIENPLALGAFLALINAPGVDVSALGLDEANDAAPEGTIDAWARGLSFLSSREVYCLAPLTGDTFINGLISTHVQSMSQPTNRGERICFLWSLPPVTNPPTTVASGSDGESNGSDDSITLETNTSDEVIGAGITDLADIGVDEGLYLELLVVSGGVTDLRRYSVKQVNGVVLNLRTTFAAGENDDGFFSTTVFDGSGGYDNLDWTLKIQGADLYVAGTTTLDLNKVAEAAASEAKPYASRRVNYLYAKSIDVSINGMTQNVPAYYAGAAIAGMTAQLEPQQPFTNVPIGGIGKVYGTDDTFSENQMDVIADGGRNILVNQGGNVASRHHRTTSTTSIESREACITKSIDWLAKGLRATNRVFIGRYVITQGFLDQLTMSNQGFLHYAVQLGVVKEANLKNILQDSEEPDTILVDVEVDPQYPANKIRITIVA